MDRSRYYYSAAPVSTGMGPLAGQLGEWLCRAVQPPAPTPCGSPGGPPVTARRVRVRDGRHLAYEESGVPRENARFKVVFSHGFTGSRLDSLRASPEVAEELGVYMVGFDRAGYGESDPNPARTVESAALDMEDLADALGLGDKFYVVGFSLGCHAVWGALRYIPERIAGAAMLAPVVNYWWPGFPAELAAREYGRQQRGDQWALRVSHHAPGILHWWMEQRWLPLPTSTVVDNTTYLPNKRDAEIRRTLTADGTLQKKREMATQQGIQESYYRDMAVMFGAAPPSSDEEKNSLDDQEEPDQQDADEQTQEEEEEVQVVDRGTVVEVKVSTQPQAHNSGARVHRSSLVINKFVGAEPVNTPETNDTAAAPPKPSALSATAPLPEDYGTTAPPGEGKVLMTTRQRRSKQEVLNHMRRCGQLSGRLFIWEPRVATSS